jgi:Cof subfamily protein (haloacid dehalogenase superfamily)
MKKYNGILIVSDLDGTLLNANSRLSCGNAEAIKYFMDNGGTFTYATGRNIDNIVTIRNVVTPNAPVIALNGAIIFDFETKKIYWRSLLNYGITNVLEVIDRNFPDSGIEVYTDREIYFCRQNKVVKRSENLISRGKKAMYGEIPLPWAKVVLLQPESETAKLRKFVEEQNFGSEYVFCQSWATVYQILSANGTKGNALKELKKILPDIHTVIAVGDNENDLEMIKVADIGYATENAAEILKSAADRITLNHNKDIMCDIISQLISVKQLPPCLYEK